MQLSSQETGFVLLKENVKITEPLIQSDNVVGCPLECTKFKEDMGRLLHTSIQQLSPFQRMNTSQNSVASLHACGVPLIPSRTDSRTIEVDGGPCGGCSFPLHTRHTKSAAAAPSHHWAWTGCAAAANTGAGRVCSLPREQRGRRSAPGCPYRVILIVPKDSERGTL